LRVSAAAAAATVAETGVADTAAAASASPAASPVATSTAKPTAKPDAEQDATANAAAPAAPAASASAPAAAADPRPAPAGLAAPRRLTLQVCSRLALQGVSLWAPGWRVDDDLFDLAPGRPHALSLEALDPGTPPAWLLRVRALSVDGDDAVPAPPGWPS